MTTKQTKNKKQRRSNKNTVSLYQTPKLIKPFRTILYNYVDISGLGAWNLFQPLTLDQGLDYHERKGNFVMVTRLEWDLHFRPSAFDGNNTFRMGFFQMNNPEATAVDLSPNFYEPINPFTCKTLFETYVHCYNVPSSATEGNGLIEKRVVGSKNIQVLNGYVGAANTDIYLNKIVFACESDSDAVPHPTMWGWIRFYFHSTGV